MKYIGKIVSIFLIILFCITNKGPLDAELTNENKNIDQKNGKTSVVQNENEKETDLNLIEEDKRDDKNEPNSNSEGEKDKEQSVKEKEEPHSKNEQNPNGNYISILILEAISGVLISVCYTLDRIIRVTDKIQEFLRIYLTFFPPNENKENEFD